MSLPSPPPGTVDALACDLARLVLEHDPVAATNLGLHDRDHELPPPTDLSVEAHVRDLRRLRDEVAALDVDGIEADVDRRGLLANVDAHLDALELDRSWERNPFTWAREPLESVLVLLLRTHLDADHRRAAVAGRLAAVPSYLAEARTQLDPGVVPPEWVPLAAGTAAAGASFMRDAVPAAHPEVADAAHAAAAELEAFGGWLTDTLAPEAAGSYPVGEERLTRLLGRVHLLDTTPAAVAARGAELLERCTAALEDAAGGDWRAALAEVRRSHPAIDELVPAYRAELRQLERYCFEGDLVTDPVAEATLEPTPAFLRQFLGYAAYLQPGVFDEVQSGVLWVTPPAQADGLADHAYAAIPAITAHEGYPGHHLQLTTVAGLDSVARKLRGGTSLMVEGWGLYVEELMHEVGYYTPEARLVQLAMTAWRAVRIVVDMQLHSGAMALEEAVDLLVERAGISRGTATTEVYRYTMTATQPFTYLYGAEEIRRIRGLWRERTGGSLRAFHDALLAYGHLPPALVAEALVPESA